MTCAQPPLGVGKVLLCWWKYRPGFPKCGKQTVQLFLAPRSTGQVDFAAKDQGRVLQMVFATGTNEAWLKTDHCLKARVAQ